MGVRKDIRDADPPVKTVCIAHLTTLSNMKVNIRMLDWHFQIDGKWKCSLTKNSKYHSEIDYSHGLWSIYTFFGWI